MKNSQEIFINPTTGIGKNMDMEKGEFPTDVVMLFVRASGMRSGKAGNLLGAADPFFEVKNEQDEIVASSAIFRNDEHPLWPPIRLDIEALCECDPTRDITISFFDWGKSGCHELMGEFITNLGALEKAASRYETQLNVGFLDKLETYNLGEAGKVFVYDLIYITGFPTAGTLIKTRNVSSALSTADTEPDSDSDSLSLPDEDQDSLMTISEAPSVCPSASSVKSGDSTVMFTNGDASPRRKPSPMLENRQVQHTNKARRNRGKSLFSGLIIPEIEDHIAEEDPFILEEDEPFLAAELRGMARACDEVSDNYDLAYHFTDYIGDAPIPRSPLARVAHT